MVQKPLRNVAGALGLVLAVTVASVPLDTAAAAGSPAPIKETSWAHAISLLPEMTSVVHGRHVIALANAKTSLSADVWAAKDLFESSKGKATDESRKQLAVQRNRAYSIVIVSDDEKVAGVAQVQLNASMDAVKADVAAWEEAEAKRIAEEARIAAEAAAAAAAASAPRPAAARHASVGTSARASSGGSASGQTPQQYLEGIAASYGGSISWSDAPCGRSMTGGIGGCFQGGSTLYVTNSAYGSWSSAKGSGRSVVIHEASHMIILSKCGTVAIGGARFENVTDAYSVLLGGGGAGYGYNDNDMAIATAALGGQCLAG